jgi:hypothetical protein
MLARLIYASEAAASLTPDSVQALLAHARRNNRLRDITGMLAFDSRYFLQAIEGGRQPLSDLYARLVQDRRHQRLMILSFDTVLRRSFSSWTMGFAGADASRRSLYLLHGASGQFEPHGLSGPAALALLTELAEDVEHEAREPTPIG